MKLPLIILLGLAGFGREGRAQEPAAKPSATRAPMQISDVPRNTRTF